MKIVVTKIPREMLVSNSSILRLWEHTMTNIALAPYAHNEALPVLGDVHRRTENVWPRGRAARLYHRCIHYRACRGGMRFVPYLDKPRLS